VALLTNPTAGRGRAAEYREVVLGRLRDSGCEVLDLQGTDAADAERLARRAVADGVESLVVCGGDGTVHTGLQAVAGTGVRLGVVAAGTGNDVARYLDLPRDDPRAATDRVIAGRTTSLDLAKAGGRWFVTVMAAGFDAVVNERANSMHWPRGQMRYNIATLAELRTFEPLEYVLDLDGREVRTRAMLVAVGNVPSFGGGLRIAEGADLHDGLLDVVVVGAMGRGRLVRLYPRLFRGTHTSAPEFTRHRVRSVTVASPGIVAYVDGERLGPLPITVESVPDAVEVHS